MGFAVPGSSPCTNPALNFTNITDAINSSSVTTGQTILVAGPDTICDTCQPRVYPESLTINKRICLKAATADFWTASANSDDFRYAAVIRSTANHVIKFERAGSGSCVRGFALDHDGGTGSAVEIGISDVTGVLDLAGHVDMAGRGIQILRNLILGNRVTNSRGVQMIWNFFDDTTCADWNNDNVLGNYIRSFDAGVHYFMSGPVNCGFSQRLGRIDQNDIRDCKAGVQGGAGGAGSPYRITVMENHIAQGRQFSTNPLCTSEQAAAIGIDLADTFATDIIGNRISQVDIGIHLAYDACYTRVRNNDVRANGTTIDPRAVWICPSHCNLLQDNHLRGTDAGTGTGIDFSNRRSACETKAQGTHTPGWRRHS